MTLSKWDGFVYITGIVRVSQYFVQNLRVLVTPEYSIICNLQEIKSVWVTYDLVY